MSLSVISQLNPYLTNGFAHPYHLGDPTSILGASGLILIFTSFFDENPFSKRIAPDGAPRSAASQLGLYFLPMSHKKTPGLNGLLLGNDRV